MTEVVEADGKYAAWDGIDRVGPWFDTREAAERYAAHLATHTVEEVSAVETLTKKHLTQACGRGSHAFCKSMGAKIVEKYAGRYRTTSFVCECSCHEEEG